MMRPLVIMPPELMPFVEIGAAAYSFTGTGARVVAWIMPVPALVAPRPPARG